MKIQNLAIILLTLSLITENPPHVEATCSTNSVENGAAHSAPAYNPRIVDSFGKAITGTVKSGQQIQITSDITNERYCDQPFAYLVQIQDINGVTVSLSWITGTLPSGQSLSPAQSWIPTASGTYTAQIFFWQSLNNPNAIQPPESWAIEVCDSGLVAVMKYPTNTLVCVKPDTAQKLVEERWGQLY